MAWTSIKDAEVTYLNKSGFGVKVVERNKFGDRESKQFFTLWFKAEHGLVVGQIINVSGYLSAKVGEPWTDNDGNERRTAELSLNSPRIDTASSIPTPTDDDLPF